MELYLFEDLSIKILYNLFGIILSIWTKSEGDYSYGGVWHMDSNILILLIVGSILISVVCALIHSAIRDAQYKELVQEVLKSLNLKDWKFIQPADDIVYVKSSKAVNDYTSIKYFKDNRYSIETVMAKLAEKKEYAQLLNDFLNNNDFKNRSTYSRLVQQINSNLKSTKGYYVTIYYSSPTGRSTNSKQLILDEDFLNYVKSDPSLIMSKSEFNKFTKERNAKILNDKQHEYYKRVNDIIDKANEFGDKLIIKSDQDELDKQVSSLYDKTVNSIKKIKSVDSEEWDILTKIISNVDENVNKIIDRNNEIVEYYNSSDFNQIKDACKSLMDSQREFNEYIDEKAKSISALFGVRVVRNETVVDDENNYIRPYKKSITPFTAEVSSSVFASAENNPLDYVVKYFYPNKELYPLQIQKLQLLVEELETLKEAKQIIDNYKKEYHQFITNVPQFILDNDEDGFYSRLGFANISESVLTVEYRFSYTSDGGMAHRSFTVPMKEDTIVLLVQMLQSKLTMAAFAKEQRNMMTSKLRQHIKERDNYTCKYCGNSTFKEPNLLLEIDHIIPVAKGGCTVEDNLQTLCWKCNRQKSSKLITEGN